MIADIDCDALDDQTLFNYATWALSTGLWDDRPISSIHLTHVAEGNSTQLVGAIVLARSGELCIPTNGFTSCSHWVRFAKPALFAQ